MCLLWHQFDRNFVTKNKSNFKIFYFYFFSGFKLTFIMENYMSMLYLTNSLVYLLKTTFYLSFDIFYKVGLPLGPTLR